MPICTEAQGVRQSLRLPNPFCTERIWTSSSQTCIEALEMSKWSGRGGLSHSKNSQHLCCWEVLTETVTYWTSCLKSESLLCHLNKVTEITRLRDKFKKVINNSSVVHLTSKSNWSLKPRLIFYIWGCFVWSTSWCWKWWQFILIEVESSKVLWSRLWCFLHHSKNYEE